MPRRPHPRRDKWTAARWVTSTETRFDCPLHPSVATSMCVRPASRRSSTARPPTAPADRRVGTTWRANFASRADGHRDQLTVASGWVSIDESGLPRPRHHPWLSSVPEVERMKERRISACTAA